MKNYTIVILFMALPYVTLAQLRPLNFSRLTNEEGLSQATVNVMYKDRDDFLWIGTDDGLNRFDGVNVKTFYYQFNDTTTMAANEVYGICEDKYNRLWVAHYNAGISIYDKETGKFIRIDNRVPVGKRLSSHRIYGLMCDSKGFIWARTVVGISKIDPSNFSIKNFDDVSFSTLSTLVNIDVIEFANSIWFGSKTNGLLRVTPNGKKYPLLNWDVSKHGASISGIWVDNAHTLMVATEKGLFKIDSKKGYEIESILEDAILFNTASKLFREKNTPFVWVATEQGILVVNVEEKKLARHIKSEAIKDNLVSNVILGLFQDEEQNIIIGTNRGINISSPFTSVFYNYENIFRKIPHFGHPVYAIHNFKNGDLLIGTKNGGAKYFDAKSFSVSSISIPNSHSKYTRVYHFTAITESRFLMATSKGVWELNVVNKKATVSEARQYPELKQLALTTITDIVFANDSIAYLAGFTDGFYKWNYKKGIVKQYKKDEKVSNKGPVSDEILNIVPADNGSMVLCTKFGFSVYNPSEDFFVNFLPGKKYPDELPARNIKDAFDDGTNIWLATFGAGVQKYNKRTRKFTGYTIREGLPNNSVYAVVPDNKGNMWIPTNNGLAVLKIKSGNVRTFTTGDGLPDNEFNAYASYKAPGGALYFSTLNGIVKAKPELILDNPYTPKIAVTHFEASGNQNDSVFNVYNKSVVNIPAGFNSLYLQFSALSFAAPGKNQFKIRLEGFDNDWIDIGTRTVWRYTNLPPGDYRLYIIGTNNSGKWSKEPYKIKINIEPLFYETLFFKFLLAMAVVAVLYAFYRSRINQILKVEKLRRKISHDLHDDIGSTLSSINIYSELARNEKDNISYIETIQQHTQNIISSLDDLVWSINPKNDTIPILIERMQSFAEPFLSAKKISTRFTINIQDPTLSISLDQRRNIYLSFKEMINNVVKHSGCTQCNINVIQKGRHINITVRDDGKGFNAQTINTRRNGLQSLAERAKQLNGELEIDSLVGKGSEVRMNIQV